MNDVKIVIRYRTIDRFSERRVFKTVKGARAYARKRLGDYFDIGGSYAVSGDGVGKIEVDGISLRDLLEEPAVCRWFALCDRPATGKTPHPVLGEVPTCDRCAAFASGTN